MICFSHCQSAAMQYVRFSIRGKLGRGVPVLISKDLLECIELLLENRKAVGISYENPYVFGLPHPDRSHHHLDAYQLMVQFSEKCGAKNPIRK